MTSSKLKTYTIIVLSLFLTNKNYCFGQTDTNSLIVTSPDKAIIITSDITNFWIAYDKTFSNFQGNAFDTYYIKNGSAGVKDFMSNHRIISADTLLQTVLRRKSDYQRIRENTLKISTNEKQIKAPYYALKYLYPKAKFPPVYFVIGRFNTGGTITPQSQIIGAEMSEPNNIPCIVAHELIHTNQNIPYKYKILLEQCIIEGSADFLGELISGKIASTAAYEYAKGKEKELWDDFVKDIDLGENDNFSNWLYGGERKDNRPADMGYYIGYMITKAYYDKAADKSKAIEDILNITDCKEFLKKSGYNGNDLTKSTIETSQDIAREVTFICTGCKENNKFVISGTENLMFRNLKFPLKQKLKIGDYTMTYFQNRVQQIALPFKVEDKTDNTVIVK